MFSLNEFIFVFLILFMGQYYRDIDISPHDKLFSTILWNQNNQSIIIPDNTNHHHEWMSHILENNPILLSFLSSQSRPRNFMGIRMVTANHPTPEPTNAPTQSPTTFSPTVEPTGQPSNQPSCQPSEQPTTNPTLKDYGPSGQPTEEPSSQPTEQPTAEPSMQPSRQPTSKPSKWPGPTGQPTEAPSRQPSEQPSEEPSGQPTSGPSIPTSQPSLEPSRPSSQPTEQPSRCPSSQPSEQPSNHPTARPSQPSSEPSSSPTNEPSYWPTEQPTSEPSTEPSSQPTLTPTQQPSSRPSNQPFSRPSCQPSEQPSRRPSRQPTSQPSRVPSSQPSSKPSSTPSEEPSSQPSCQPIEEPSSQPSCEPSSQPSMQPTEDPSSTPTVQPSQDPTNRPSKMPTGLPTTSPSQWPSSLPTTEPTGHPSMAPSSLPTFGETLPSNETNIEVINVAQTLSNVSIATAQSPEFQSTFIMAVAASLGCDPADIQITGVEVDNIERRRTTLISDKQSVVDTTKRWEDDHSLNDLDKAYSNTLLAYVRESVADYLTTSRFSPRYVSDENGVIDPPPDKSMQQQQQPQERDYLNQATLDTLKREDEAESTLSRILLAGAGSAVRIKYGVTPNKNSKTTPASLRNAMANTKFPEALKAQIVSQSLGKFILTVAPPVTAKGKPGRPTRKPVVLPPGTPSGQPTAVPSRKAPAIPTDYTLLVATVGISGLAILAILIIAISAVARYGVGSLGLGLRMYWQKQWAVHGPNKIPPKKLDPTMLSSLQLKLPVIPTYETSAYSEGNPGMNTTEKISRGNDGNGSVIWSKRSKQEYMESEMIKGERRRSERLAGKQSP